MIQKSDVDHFKNLFLVDAAILSCLQKIFLRNIAERIQFTEKFD